MKLLINENYESIVGRGLIKWSTPVQAFLDKLDEEVNELKEAFENSTKDHFNEELADVILVCLNLAKHIDLDIESELKRKIEVNYSRK